MPVRQVINQGKVPVKIHTDDMEQQAFQQLANISQLPFIHSHVVAMHDVHFGKGAHHWPGDPLVMPFSLRSWVWMRQLGTLGGGKHLKVTWWKGPYPTTTVLCQGLSISAALLCYTY